MDNKSNVVIEESKNLTEGESNTANIKFVSKEDEQIMLHDISKITLQGMQSIDITQTYVENMDFKKYLTLLNQEYARISERCASYMNERKIISDFFGSLKQAFLRNAVRISMMTSSSDTKIAEHLLKGTNLGLDALAKNLNNSYATLSTELIALSKDFEQILQNSLIELRKYL